MSFRRLVVGVDGSPRARDAVRLALRFAAPDAPIVVAAVAVLPPTVGMAGGIDDPSYLLDDARRALDDVRELLDDRPDVAFASPVAPSVAGALHDLARESAADLLVVGASRHHGIGGVLLGSDAAATLHGAPCAVLVAAAPTDPQARSRPVGAAFDGTPAGRRALEVAVDIARERHVPLTVLAVLDTNHPYATYGTVGGFGDPVPDARALLDEEVARLPPALAVDSRLCAGDPAHEILALGRHVDLLVLGARRHGPVLRVLLGSVSSHVARRAACSVLVVPDSTLVVADGPVPAPTA